ncbi:hypothetical protein SLS62_000847 [Diatrype stigma]|uniref:PKS/mFAS DH domain-containing protein n=1 Tax=Diatrype stigma TaxID=117547 RepID=A0AAN9V2L7_9PEZI
MVWARMGAELMAYYPTFLESIRQLDGVLEELEDAPDWTLEDVLLENATTSRINKAEFAQPLCTAIQIALVKLLRLWGIKPAVTCGHSSGEIAAAFAAGYLTASQAIVAAYYRGKAVQGINTNGAMLAVGIGAEQVVPYLAGYSNEEVTVACHNSPSSVTLSGNAEVLQEVQQRISNDGKFARLVKTDGKAYHSRHMQPAAAKYEAFIKNAEKYLPDDSLPAEKARMVSSVTNTVIPEDMILDHNYWSANLLSPVLFNQAIQTMTAQFPEIDGLVEIGPHSALSGPINQIKAELQMDKLHYLPTLIRGVDCARSLLKTAGELFLRQYPLDLQRVTSLEEATPSGKFRRRSGNLIVDLPPYQWDKNKKYWAESRESKEHRQQKFPRHDLLGQLTIGTSLAEPTWRNVLRVKDLPWLKDHSLGGEAVFPAAGYFSMAMEAITQIHSMSGNPVDIECYVLRDVLIQQALVTPDDDNGIEVLLNMRPSAHGKGESQHQWWEFNVSSVSQEGYVKNHMVGNIGINTHRQRSAPKSIPNLPQRATGKSWNQALKEVGFNYGPTFQDMDNITFDGRTYCAHADTRVKTTVEGMIGESRHVLHPATVDSCLQLMIVAIWAGRTKAMQFGAVPVRAEEVVIWKPTDDQVSAVAGTAFSWIDPRGQRSFNAHTQLQAADGQVLMDISNMRCAAYEAAIPQRSEQPAKPRPYAGLVSKLDVAFVAGVQEAMDIADYVELEHFKDPGLRVLMVNQTNVESILAKVPGLDLTATHGLTEIVSLLEQRLTDFKNAKVQLLDLSKDLSEQSVKLNSFDLVITSYISPEALNRTRSLLVEGGRVVIDASDFLDEHTMAKAGFSSITATLQSSSTGERAFIVSATKPPAESFPLTSKFQLVYHKTVLANVSSLADELKSMGHEVELFQIGSSGPISSNVIILVDLEGPFLATVTEGELKDLQIITSTATNITWIAGQDPECAMAKGLLRCLRAERASLTATFVELDAITISSAQGSKTMAKLATLQASDGAALESEYSISNGQIFISRLIPIERINHDYGYDEAEPESVPFDPKKRLVGKVVAGKVVFEHAPEAEPSLAPEEVEVAVLATGLNRHDVSVISGTEFPTDFSHEISGVVCRTGSEVRNLVPGDNVVGFSSSKFATFQYTDQCLVQKLEPGESFLTMASLPMQYAAALHGLEDLANLQAGESVFILPGSGLVGAAAVHVTRALHGVPYVAVRHASEAEETARSLGLEPSQIVDWSTQSSEQLVADIVFSTDAVEPSVAREAWRHLSPFSRFVGCADRDTVSSAVIDSVPITRGVSYLSFNVVNLFKKPKVLGQLLARTVQLVRQGAVPAPVVSVRNITEINDSVASLEDKISGPKIVIEHIGTDSGTLQVIPSRPRLQLRPDATYFLVGCLGGLGRALTSWMMGRGARNFAFLSRSGTDSKQAAILVDNLKAAGVNVQVFRGDASVKEDVQKAITSVSPDRPVRGVVNAAMVLRVSDFAAQREIIGVLAANLVGGLGRHIS